MKKYMKTIFSIMIILLSIISIFPKNVSAEWDAKGAIDGTSSWNEKYTQTDTDKVGNNTITRTTEKIVGSAISIIRIVATGVAIIMLTYVAIKYMSAAPSEKAEYKKSATAYIVGAIVLFATTGILGIIQDFATNNIVS